MAKAKVIGGLEPLAETRSSLPAMFAVRIGELWAFADHLEFPERVRELHDMRIAAKRLRYLFEFFAHCFDERLGDTLKKFKRLQDYLGEVHDCDVWVDYLRTQLRQAFREVNQKRKELDGFVGAASQLGEPVRELAGLLASGPVQGLLMMLDDVVVRRAQLYQELVQYWQNLSAQDFRSELTRTVAAAARGPELAEEESEHIEQSQMPAAVAPQPPAPELER